MWGVDENGGVFPGRRLQAELGIRRLGIVGEGDGAGQLAIVQHLLVVLSQVDVTLWLKLESALRWWREEEEEDDDVVDVKGHMRKTLNLTDTREEWVCVKLDTHNGVCLIAAWALCEQQALA